MSFILQLYRMESSSEMKLASMFSSLKPGLAITTWAKTLAPALLIRFKLVREHAEIISLDTARAAFAVILFPDISRTSSEGADSLRALARAIHPSSAKLRLVQVPSASAKATPPSKPTFVEEQRKFSKIADCFTSFEIAIFSDTLVHNLPGLYVICV